MKLYAAVALGLVLGLLLGLVASVSGSPALIAFAEGLEPLGTAFVDLLKMVVIPLVVAIIFLGVAGLGDLSRLGKLGSLTLLFFAATSALGVLIGMGVMQLLLPLASEAAAQAVGGATAEAPVLPGPLEFLLGLIPSNPFQVAAEGALLPLIVFTILFAAAAGALPRPDRDRLLDLASSITAALIKLVGWILWLAPVGVFALAAPVTARAGWAMLQSLGAFILAVLLGLLLFVAAIYMPAIRFLGGMSALKFLKGSLNPIIIALSTSSTAVTVPAMIEACDKELGISRPVTSFVIPLGAGIGRMGTALFQGAGIVFLAWLFGVPLPVTGIGGAVLATFIVSFTVAGIPAGGVVSLAPALGTVGVPLDGLGVLLGVDRIPDMARTATNVTGILAAAVVIDRWVGAPAASPAVEEETAAS
ncbi:MAG: dicarboxylate/amino acid:cation symporter [Gemmatimonadales bacterium]|jgi:DAACS family dicarboxylate/amino acid:cation (Na+ or H+) symporter